MNDKTENKPSARTPPYNTGRVQIGLCYIPRTPGWGEQSADADLIQKLLLSKERPYRPTLWQQIKYAFARRFGQRL